MQSLLVNPEWVLGGLLLCMVGWVLLRGPKVLSNLKQVRSRRQEIELRRGMFADQAAKASRNRTAKARVSQSYVDGEETLMSPENLKKNWRWLLAGFGFVAIGVFSFLTPHALDSYEFVGRRRGIGMMLQVLWGWPIGIAGLVFGLLCVFGSFMPMDE